MKFAGPAVTVMLKKEDTKRAQRHRRECSTPSTPQLRFGLRDGPGERPRLRRNGRADGHRDEGPGAGRRRDRWVVRDTPQIRRIQFPVFSRGVAPSTTINHYRALPTNTPLTCAGVRVNPGDIISADEDGVVVIPKARAAEILKKAQDLDNTEHSMMPFIEKFKSIKEAVAKFGRI